MYRRTISAVNTLIFDIIIYCVKDPGGALALFCPNITVQNAVADQAMPIAAGAVLGVTCSAGYWLSAGTTNQTVACSSNGTWAGSPRPCVVSDCGLPPMIQYATRSTTNVVYDTALTYRCISGYWFPDINGVTKNIKCTGVPPAWSPIAPAVSLPQDCSAVVCAQFVPPANAWIDTYAVTAGTVLNVWCKVGYLFANGRRAVQYVCSESAKTWQLQVTPQFTPLCRAVACPIPDVRNAIAAAGNRTEIYVSEQVTFACNQSGYQFPGGRENYTSNCTFSGDLVPMPPSSGCQAVRNDCGDAPWTYYNGSCYYVSNLTDVRNFSDAETACVQLGAHLLFVKSKAETAYLAALAGMKVVGALERWIGLHKSNAAWVWTSGYAPINYTAWFTGYPEDWTCAAMSYGGGWKDKVCSVANPYLCRKEQVCRTPPEIDYGNITSISTPSYADLGTTLTYRCFDGYWVASTRMLEQDVTCMRLGSWSFVESCQKIRCPSKVRVENAVGNTTSTEYGTYTGYTCKPGFLYPDGSAVKVARCGGDGQWRGIYTDCQKIQCPLRATKNAAFVNGRNEVGAVDTYTCNEGYEYSDGTIAKQYNCMSTGVWSPDLTCSEVRCPTFRHSNASVNMTTDRFMGVARVTCFTGYRFFHGNYTYRQHNVTCLANKSWSGVPPPCLAMSCPTPLPTVRNAVANGSGVTARSVVNYTCVPPMTYIDGAKVKSIYCDPATAQWTQEPTECIDPDSILPPSFPDRPALNSRVVLIGQSVLIGLVALAAVALLLELCDGHLTTSRLLSHGRRGTASDAELRD